VLLLTLIKVTFIFITLHLLLILIYHLPQINQNDVHLQISKIIKTKTNSFRNLNIVILINLSLYILLKMLLKDLPKIFIRWSTLFHCGLIFRLTLSEKLKRKDFNQFLVKFYTPHKQSEKIHTKMPFIFRIWTKLSMELLILFEATFHHLNKLLSSVFFEKLLYCFNKLRRIFNWSFSFKYWNVVYLSIIIGLLTSYNLFITLHLLLLFWNTLLLLYRLSRIMHI
jgi:hypothetical protein